MMESKYDLFTKVSDRRDIVEFVKEIEKYPCLYDKTLPEYANKVHNRRAWSTIAKKINTTVPDCRDKWRKIRISFMRSLKQQQSDKPPMRPYYLAEDLHFLRPFLKINPKTSTPKEEQMEFETLKQDISDSEGSDNFEIEEPNGEREIERVMFKEASVIKERPKDIKVYPKPNGRNSYSEDMESSARKMFLLSLLPDVECFTESEMRIFRREVINVCDSIINRRKI
ncbi:uncharacterized protein LOC142983971 [Anticarsia gemmatalis]|uniref:uncharacterized protein LOC142983971 n=1 Tax=Anticarsia gemmatalis TaxID=129554 RepID=UPI003F7618F1